MTINFTIKTTHLKSIGEYMYHFATERTVFWIAFIFAISSTAWFYNADVIVAYGDAESHLNIAKRVVDSLTPGLAQLGGIWLPLPHLLMVPFVKFDFLWRSGLAGSIVNGVSFIISAMFIFKICNLLFKNSIVAFIGSLVFMLNLNILYLQATSMTELTLLVFFMLSTYYFLKFTSKERILDLIIAAFFGYCATLSRYDGWFFVGIEILILMIIYNPIKTLPRNFGNITSVWNSVKWEKMQGIVILFGTLGFLGIVMWLGWDALILGDPLYFSHSQFSASSQQQGWLAKGQLPAYHNLWLSFLYYLVTAMNGVGMLIFFASLVGFFLYVRNKKNVNRFIISFLMTSMFIFYVLTLYLGQSIIFIPHLTPLEFEWTLFNARYGVMMVPFAAIFFAYLFACSKVLGKTVLLILIVAQLGLYAIGYSQPLSFTDGTQGLSQAKRPDAEIFLAKNYDYGLVLLDDYSRLISIIRSNIPIENVIYIGNKPYWEESLQAPEKYARWIIVQQNDMVDIAIYQPPQMNGRLFKYFKLTYTSPEILIFQRNELPPDSP